MPTERTILVYKFDELSERAKERARDWYRGCIATEDFDTIIEDVERMGAILGIEIQTHGVRLMNGATRQDPSVWWQLDGQGQGASYSGFYRYAKGSCKAIKAETNDKELIRIASALTKAQKATGYKLEVKISAREAGHWNMGFEYEDFNVSEAEQVEEALKDFAKWIFKQLQAQSEYLYSEENVDDSIIANEYDFDMEGKRI